MHASTYIHFSPYYCNPSWHRYIAISATCHSHKENQVTRTHTQCAFIRLPKKRQQRLKVWPVLRQVVSSTPPQRGLSNLRPASPHVGVALYCTCCMEKVVYCLYTTEPRRGTSPHTTDPCVRHSTLQHCSIMEHEVAK